MQRQPVQSTSLQSVGYDEKSRTLEIEFCTGGIYHYYDVPAKVYQALLAAPSLGQYFGAEIKDVYRYDQVG